MAVHGGPVFDRVNSGHGHRVDRKIIQKTALGMFIHIYLYVYYLPILVIRKCVQCTLLVREFFAKIHLPIRRLTYVRSGPKRNSNCVQFMQFYGVGTLFATIINKGFIILR